MDDASSRHILLFEPDPRFRRMAARALAATDATVCDVGNLDEARSALTTTPPWLVVIGAEARLIDGAAEMLAAARGAGAKAEIVTVADLSGGAPAIWQTAGLRHIVTNPGAMLIEELAATVFKLKRADAAGAEPYLSWGAELAAHTLLDAGERAGWVSKVSEVAQRLGLGDRVAARAALLADELLSNALYNAPVDGQGVRLHGEQRRDEARALSERERVTLRFGSDARYFVVEVSDRFGSLQAETIARHVGGGVERRQVSRTQERGAGAGLGLSLSHHACNSLVFNVRAGQSTQAIGLIDVRFKATELGRLASLHVFEQDPEVRHA